MRNTDNPNINHRSRLKEKYKKGGLDILSFHERLELLLFYSIPRKDTNKIAHELEKKFNGSLANIFEASETMLKEVNGLGKETALYFKLLADITRQYNIERANRPTEIIDKKFHEEFLVAHYTGKQKEEVVLLSLNNRMERISADVIYVGSVNSAKVDMNKMAKTALEKTLRE